MTKELCSPVQHTFSRGWAQGFLRRHQLELELSLPTLIDNVRYLCTTKEVLFGWYKKYCQIVQECEFDENLVFNFDETSLLTLPIKHKVVSIRGSEKRPQVRVNLCRFNCTMGMCISASGKSLKSLFILKNKTFSGVPQYLLDSVAVGYQPSAWIDKTILHNWAELVLIPHIKHVRNQNPDMKRKALLVMDNHSSRQNEDFLQLMKENEVIVVFLPPHSSHISQPLDVGIYGPFKSLLRKKMRERSREIVVEEEEEEMITYRGKIIEVAFSCWESISTRMNIRNAFSKTKIFPAKEFHEAPGEQLSSSIVSERTLNMKSSPVVTGEMLQHHLRNKKAQQEAEKKRVEENKKRREENKKNKEEEKKKKAENRAKERENKKRTREEVGEK